ncbi:MULTISPECIES: hypothetical protein [Eikenella]|uniref:Secreted protein n=1 Tax=Eikenella longinqua TaxID=1795827 RepID=A0A1A9RX35_9NEIS|nr:MULTISPECIES: hypothetical protein [Eikenella]OAM26847.1 hypothetical protein A7P95_08845 [Eikenella longinqua]
MRQALTLLALACLLPLPALADIPQSRNTQCFQVAARGKIGPARPCRAEAVDSAPRPNLPDTRSLRYQIGSRSYQFSADYDAERQSWQPSYQGQPLTVYYRSRAFRRLAADGAAARYVCFRAPGVHFCSRKLPAPFW